MQKMPNSCAVLVVCCVVGLATAAAEPWSPPTVQDVAAALDGLGFDDFIETSYRMHLLRFPEHVTWMGIAQEYGIRNDALNDYSQTYTLNTFEIESLILDELLGFDPAELTTEQRTTYEICRWYWEDAVRGQAFFDTDHPIHFMTTRSLHGIAEFTLTGRHPLTCEEDIVDYLARLNGIGEQFDGIIEQLERRESIGIIAPRLALEWAIGDIRTRMTAHSTSHPLYEPLRVRAAGLDGLSADTLAAYLMEAEGIVDDVVKPAYGRLYAAIMSALDDAPDAISLSQYPGGDEAYAYLLRHHTQTDLTADDIHALGLREVGRVQAEILEAATELGFEDEVTVSAIFAEAAARSGTVTGEQAVAEADALIAKATRIVLETGALSRLPDAGVIVVGGDQGGFYTPPAMDGSRPGAYHIATSRANARFSQPSVAFHETIPGHHVQVALAQQLDLPLLRQDAVFTGFSEGWALYAERLMSELRGYEDDPLGNLGRLKYELLRAVRLVVDTGIHDLGWSFEEAVTYIMESAGDTRGTAEYRTLRYTVIPGQSTAYMVGLLELLDLRQKAQDALGELFTLATFHDILLANGNVPLSLVEGFVDTWIDGG